MIIDLDISLLPKKKEQKQAPPKPVQVEPVPLTLKKAPPETEETDRKTYLLNQIQEKENYIRHQRAMVHRKYRNYLDEKLIPKKGAENDMLELYEEIDSFTEDLKNLYIKRQQIEKHGDLRPQKILTNEDLAKIAALKHRRSRVNDNLYKAKKAVAMAQSSGNTEKESNAILKIEQLELEYLEIANELKKLEDVR